MYLSILEYMQLIIKTFEPYIRLSNHLQRINMILETYTRNEVKDTFFMTGPSL